MWKSCSTASQQQKKRKLKENTDLVHQSHAHTVVIKFVLTYTLSHYCGNVQGSNKTILASTFLNITVTYNDPHEVI